MSDLDYIPLGNQAKLPFWKSKMFAWCIIGISVLAIILVGVTLGVVLTKKKDTVIAPLENNIYLSRIMTHLNQLDNIAKANEGSRTAFTGYNASVDYILYQLAATNWFTLTQQWFTASFYTEINATMGQTAPRSQTFTLKQDFQTLRFSGSGSVSAKLNWVNTGCNDSDWTSFVAGDIAFIQREAVVCSIAAKVAMAVSHNAAAVVMMYDPQGTGLFSAGLTSAAPIPCFAITYALGSEFRDVLSDRIDVRLDLWALTEVKNATNANVFATTPGGDENNIIVVGSHLDSVPAGPGINDNGSGSSVNLELAFQVWNSTLGSNLKNKIVFAWWAAEEIGLVGSRYFVNSVLQQNNLPFPIKKEQIALNLNFDMLGSPNFHRGIFNGSSGPENVKQGSSGIQSIFEEYFKKVDLTYDLMEFGNPGRSDFASFIENGIPAGGLATGAEVRKSMESRKLFGGIANAAYDPCYHLACDTVANINQDVIVQMGKAAAYTLQNLAMKENLATFLGK